jgi:type III pantothenate kinase
MPNLVVDIGNTSTKIAVFNQRDLLHYQRFEQLEEQVLSDLIAQYQIKNATVSSVNKESDQLIAYLTKSVHYIPFSTAVTGDIKNHYETLATLGLDRWAKVIAANGLYKGRNCLMIDAGTCITYDLLNAGSEYFGGSISLGITMRFEALNHFTERLPLVAWELDENIPKGSNTINAIKNGVLQGVMHEVEGFISDANKKNENLMVVLTGGDADFLNKQLKNSIFASQIEYEPYLVLKGLNEVITLSHVQ